VAVDQHAEDILEDESPEGAGAWIREVVETWGPAVLAVMVIRTFIFEPFRIPSGSMVPTLLIGDHVLVTKFTYGIWFPSDPLYYGMVALAGLGLWVGGHYTGPNVGVIPLSKTFFTARFAAMALGTVLLLPVITGSILATYSLLSGWQYERFEAVDTGDPDRGDIIVFRYPRDPGQNYIKRVVGIPGDKIKVSDNQIILNGTPQEKVATGEYEDINDQCRARSVRHHVEQLETSQGVLAHDILTNRGLGGGLSNHREITVPPGNVFVMGDNRDNSQDSRAWSFVSFDKIKGKSRFIWLSWNGCGGWANLLRFDRMGQSLYGPPLER